MNNIILPRNVTVDFPLRHCEKCLLCEPTLDDLFIRFDGTEQYRFTCKHAVSCQELYLLGRSEMNNEILCGK